MKHFKRRLGVLGSLLCLLGTPALGAVNLYLTGVPDYAWFYGCMGTASGNLLGYWDRHGFPDFYAGRCNNGLAPLNTVGANVAITSFWASQAGVDGRPNDKPGHVDDYYDAFESDAPDKYLVLGRPEHEPDCIGDFIGLSQNKWKNMAGECSGNIDGFSFVYWDTNGSRRVNFTPTLLTGEPATDIQSGYRAWTRWRGYDCEVFTQLMDFNPKVPEGKGFTYEDLKREIDQGYPVVLFMQGYNSNSRKVGAMPNANPNIHAMVAYGYYINNGRNYVRYRTSWASGDNSLREWTSAFWETSLPVRGVIGYRPLPKIRSWHIRGSDLELTWDAPASELKDGTTGNVKRVHGYVVQMSPALSNPTFTAISPVLTTNIFTVTNSASPAYFRIQLKNL